ncbi:UNVERIFIED_CONTAM: 2-oxoglutarate-dependent dioxygenase 19 [Sesamum latifolium]|uniref:2-oxoglutarate-dependent dioxygenase 19 n=1 Tax=Sesamum latifolium TaxID=2727402 RepID=A0AAW2UZ67_9LAMI
MKMAATAPMKPSNIVENSFVKALAESSTLNSVPSHFSFANDSTASHSDSIPVIDFSLLASGTTHQRAKVLRDLDNACRDWGFFVLVNHGIPDSLLKNIKEASLEYFELPEEDKWRYEAKSASDPIKSAVAASSIRPTTGFTCGGITSKSTEVLLEYSERTRKLARKLVEAVFDALELEQDYVYQVLKLDSSFQIFATNFYPRCPEPDQAIGIHTHTDPDLFTFLIHNGVAGLQIEHNGHWFNADSLQNSILVNAADQLQILSNGRYKSVKHRAVVNSEKERISIVVANGPAGEAVVGPAAPLVQKDGRPLYHSMKYVEYVESQLTNSRVDGKSFLQHRMIDTSESEENL